MTIEEFKENFYCKIDVQNHGNAKLEILSQAIRRSDGLVVDSVHTSIDIPETSNWLRDSQSVISATPWNWEKLLDFNKRAHLDYFAQRAPIDNFFPLNKEDNPDIDDLYES